MELSSFNSVSFSANDAVLNITPSADVDRTESIVFYKEFGNSAWIEGESYTGTAGVAGDVTQGGLSAGITYEFMIIDTDGDLYSLPSVVKSACSSEYVSESKLVLLNLQTLLANCSIVQGWFGSSVVETVKERIYLDQFNDKIADSALPYIVIGLGEETKTDRVDTDSFILAGSLDILIANECSGLANRDESLIIMNELDRAGQLISELQEKQGMSGLLVFQGIALKSRPEVMEYAQRTEDDTSLVITEIEITLGV